MKKVALFIDGSNMYAAAMSLGFRVDYKKLLAYFSKDHNVLRAFYFTALPPKDVRSPLRTMVDFVEHNGYTAIVKETKTYIDDATGAPKLKGNMDLDMAAYIWKYHDLIDEIILFSGDGDFRPVVERAQECGCRVRVVSTLKGKTARGNPSSMCADVLRRQADEYTDLADIQPFVTQERVREPMTTAQAQLFDRRKRFLAGG